MIKKKFLFWGDSTVDGQHISLSNKWIYLVAKELEEDYSIEISARNGETTRQALERMPHDVQEAKADYLYVQYGLNDCNRWETDKGLSRVSLNSFRYNLYEIIERAFNFDIKVVFVATNHPAIKNTIYPQCHVYNGVIRNVVEDFISGSNYNHRVILVDHEKDWLTKNKIVQNLLLQDGVHLNDVGHMEYYITFMRTFSDFLQTIL
ncbi:SGNH/GDSL hydrolase family protein [Candidatus Pacearchaeota archaeon]|jgi:lysophospholipase L1-like esterase|nr:SGNH/GDSL hydrolase family protein [Candidatus Pacearchaeota archaeon]